MGFGAVGSISAIAVVSLMDGAAGYGVVVVTTQPKLSITVCAGFFAGRTSSSVKNVFKRSTKLRGSPQFEIYLVIPCWKVII